MKDFLAEGGATYTLTIVSASGHVAATTTARKRTVPLVQIGNASTSDTTVYYLDGDSDVRFLRPDGATGLATHVVLAANQVAAFSVSPDDRRIAVSVLDYTRYPVGTRLYVEDLQGGGNHVELFSSPTVMEWPVGWHAGHLVMAIGTNVSPQNIYDGFAEAHGYHVADAQTGQRLLSLCDGEYALTPESPAGAVCLTNTTASVVSWDGNSRLLPDAQKPDATSGVCALQGPLSPAGVLATDMASVSQGGCTSGPTVFRVTASGAVDPTAVAHDAAPVAWIDADHLIVDTNAFKAYATPAFSIVTISTLAAAPVSLTGFVAGMLPGGL
jgi:hypothetical protein